VDSDTSAIGKSSIYKKKGDMSRSAAFKKKNNSMNSSVDMSIDI
jgi:hypothetical protein